MKSTLSRESSHLPLSTSPLAMFASVCRNPLNKLRKTICSKFRHLGYLMSQHARRGLERGTWLTQIVWRRHKMRFTRFQAVALGSTLASALTCGLMTSSTSANVLADPGFESQTVAPNPNPTGVPGWANFGGAQFSQTYAHTGSWSLWTPDNGGGYNVPGTYQDFAASPGRDVYFLGLGFYAPTRWWRTAMTLQFCRCRFSTALRQITTLVALKRELRSG